MSSGTAIINYGMGNLASVQKAFQFLGHNTSVISDASQLKNYDRYVLPGVGAFGHAMQNMISSGIASALGEEVIEKKKNMIGLCLGMQLLFNASNEHGYHKGLGWIRGEVKDLKGLVSSEPVPHIGWNNVDSVNDSRLLFGIERSEMVFYFVHSYACFCEEKSDVAGTTSYEIAFDSVIEKGNLFGCQFHPEKSQHSGLKLLDNFMKL